MTKRTGVSFVQIALVGGSFLLGVATALALTQFDTLPNAWKISLTVAVATIAVSLLVASFAIQILCSSSRTQSQVSAWFCGTPSPASTTRETHEGSRDSDLDLDGTDPFARSDSVRAPHPHRPEVQGVARGGRTDRRHSQPDSGSSEETKLASSASVESTRGVTTAAKAAVEVQSVDLIAAWDAYRRNGDGHFNSRGLQSVLDGLRIEATVNGGDPIGLGRRGLIVETPNRQGHFYVLPSFATSPREVADWFIDRSSGALTGRIERVISVAEGRHTASGHKAIKQGVVA